MATVRSSKSPAPDVELSSAIQDLRSGGKVKNRRQAVAIGLSEARRKGKNVPPRKSKRKSK